MPARLIRDDLLDSERVQTLPAEARWLFVVCMLTADDVGLLELSAFKLHRRAGLEVKAIEKLIPLLVDADLIRPYQAEGKTWAFMPRFRQRLQIKRAKCPLPPEALLAGDEDAISKINSLRSSPTVDNGDPPKSTAAHGKTPPEPEPEPEPEPSIQGGGDTKVVGAQKPSGAAAPRGKQMTLSDLLAAGIPKQAAEDWLTVRRTKRAPLTPTAWDCIVTEAAKAGITPAEAVRFSASMSWQGFKASWHAAEAAKANGHGAQHRPPTKAEKHAAFMADLTGRKPPNEPDPNTIDVAARVVG